MHHSEQKVKTRTFAKTQAFSGTVFTSKLKIQH